MYSRYWRFIRISQPGLTVIPSIRFVQVLLQIGVVGQWRAALTDQAVTVSSGFQRVRSKAMPLTRIAHAVRAILLASATTTTL